MVDSAKRTGYGVAWENDRVARGEVGLQTCFDRVDRVEGKVNGEAGEGARDERTRPW